MGTEKRQGCAHLYASHPQNATVTTMTTVGALRAVDPEVFITEAQLDRARDNIALQTAITLKRFKNCFSVNLTMSSPRPGAKDRNVSIKVFKNLGLQITGTHSIDMATAAIDVIRQWLGEYITPVEEIPELRRIAMVLYKYELPGQLNMDTMQQILNENGVLFHYDPCTYAGIRAKIPVQDGQLASVMIFRMGKVMISIPRQPDFDEAHAHVLGVLTSLTRRHWERLHVKSSPE